MHTVTFFIVLITTLVGLVVWEYRSVRRDGARFRRLLAYFGLLRNGRVDASSLDRSASSRKGAAKE